MLAVGTLFAILGLLTGRPRAVRSSDVLLFLGLGLHLTIVRVVTVTAPAERDAVLQDFLKVLFSCHNGYLMVEQSHSRERHGDAVLVAGHDDVVVAHAAAGLGNELHATLVGTLNVVAEGEEGI